MRRICLTITFFLWIVQFGNAQECYQTKKTCYLNYSKNQICSPECYKLPHICLINLPNNTLSEKTMSAMDDHFNITRLDIVGNISSILDTMQPPLNTSKILNITGSDLEKLFISSTTITTLTISKTKIRQLTLGHQDNLKIITISSNELEEFTNQNLANLPRVEFLDLSINRIVMFGGGFGNEPNDSDMILNPNMRQLNLSFNQLVELNNESFRSMPQLKLLDLSNNSLQNLTNEPFSMKTNLTELYLSYNRIELLSNTSFLDLQNLVVLDISFNRLNSVQPEPFSPLIKLTKLNLEGNLLKEIDFEIINIHLPSIIFCNIKNNPLSCKKLRSQLIPKSVTKSSKGNCSDRGNYYGICCFEDAPTGLGFLGIFYRILGILFLIVVCIGCGFGLKMSFKWYKLRRINDLPGPPIRMSFIEQDA